jgi:predicted nucleic acid-binding protein
MIGLDTSFLVRVAIADAADHDAARRLFIREVRNLGNKLVVVPLVLSEFVHVVTDVRRFPHALSVESAIEQAKTWWHATDTHQLHTTQTAMALFFQWMLDHRLGRKRILDTMLAATFHTAGVRRIFTSNPVDFGVFGVFELLVP